MELKKLQLFLKDYNVCFSAGVVINAAYESATICSSWQTWLEKINSELTSEELKKISVGALDILNQVPEGVELMSPIAITVEQSAAVALESARIIPRRFLEFIKANINQN